MTSDTKYTVWVGAVEVVDYYVDSYTAATIAEHWIEQGYGDDMQIERINQ